MMLGNLSVKEIEERLGIEFPKETKDFMQSTRQENANNIGLGQWHCFDIPFMIVCGDMETALKIYEPLKPFSSQCKCPLQFSIQK